MSSHERSIELLHRSNKRVRSRETSEEQGWKGIEIPERNHQNISFSDKLIHSMDYGHDGKLDDWISEDEEEDLDADDDQCCPTIKLSREEKIRIRKSWKQSLIIKLFEAVNWLQTSIVKVRDTEETEGQL